jgi:hypothetical protein
MSTITLQGPLRARQAATPGATTGRVAAARAATPQPAQAAAGAGWLDRLAAWADAAPPHHRLGCWTLYLR